MCGRSGLWKRRNELPRLAPQRHVPPQLPLLHLSSIMLILWVRSRNEISTARGTQIYSREAKS